MNPLLQFFAYSHLPSHLQDVSRPFGVLAQMLDAMLPSNPEKTVALRKLLEAKDCAVRAVLFKSDGLQSSDLEGRVRSLELESERRDSYEREQSE